MSFGLFFSDCAAKKRTHGGDDGESMTPSKFGCRHNGIVENSPDRGICRQVCFKILVAVFLLLYIFFLIESINIVL